MAAPAKSTPRDAQVMAAILKDMGVLDYEPRLINQMLEFTYRYVTDILDDAKIYSTHANKKNLDSDDVKLAIQCKMDHSFTTPPPRDLLMEIARHKNSQQLPLIKPYSLPRLPPDRCCLSAPNYKLKTLKKPRIQIGLSQFSGGPQRISLAPMQSKSSSGHSLAVVSKSQPTVTIIKPGTTSVPKPQIRVNTGIPKVVTHTSGSMSSQPGLGPSIQTRPIPSSSIYPHSGQHGGQSSSQSISHTGHAISHSGQTLSHTGHVISHTGQSLSHTGQSLSHTGQPASLGGQFLLQGGINPLKRKLEDDDYDK